MTRFVLGVDPETFKCKCRLPKSDKICGLKHIVPRFASTMLVQQQETVWHQAVWCGLYGCRWHIIGGKCKAVGSDVSQASLIWRALVCSQSPFICTAIVIYFCSPGVSWRGYPSLAVIYLGLKMSQVFFWTDSLATLWCLIVAVAFGAVQVGFPLVHWADAGIRTNGFPCGKWHRLFAQKQLDDRQLMWGVKKQAPFQFCPPMNIVLLWGQIL